MTTNPHNQDFTRDELDASLRRLGIQELQERLEFAPLLVDGGLGGDQPTDQMPCCVCKIGDPTQLDDNGMLPFPNMDPTGLN